MKCNGKMLFCKISNSFNNFFAVKRWNNPKYKDGRGSLFCTSTIVYAEMSRGAGTPPPTNWFCVMLRKPQLRRISQLWCERKFNLFSPGAYITEKTLLRFLRVEARGANKTWCIIADRRDFFQWSSGRRFIELFCAGLARVEMDSTPSLPSGVRTANPFHQFRLFKTEPTSLGFGFVLRFLWD